MKKTSEDIVVIKSFEILKRKPNKTSINQIWLIVFFFFWLLVNFLALVGLKVKKKICCKQQVLFNRLRIVEW